MPRAAERPSIPWCSRMRSSRSGRNTSTPSIRMTSSAGTDIAPVLTRQAPSVSATAAPSAMPVSVMPRASVLLPSTHIVLRKSSWARCLELPCPGAALAERLEGRQPLHRVEEIGAEGGVGAIAGEARLAVAAVPERGRQQHAERGDQQHERDRQVHERDESEDEQRRDRRHEELRADTGRSTPRAAARPRPSRASRRRFGRARNAPGRATRPARRGSAAGAPAPWRRYGAPPSCARNPGRSGRRAPAR